MPTLITGGAGFIGSHLAAALCARGERVIVLDDLSTGRRENLAGLPVEFHLGTACDYALVARLAARCTQVVHLAAAVGVRRILAEPVGSIEVNIEATRAVLAVCAGARMPVLLASSSEVYGRSTAIPFREDADLVLGPSSVHRWSYACSKLMDEFLGLAWHREHGVPVRICRFFNVTGPRQSPAYGMVLPRFCAAARAGQPLEVHGDGRQSRCFLHVDDCVAGVLALLAQPAAVGQVVNIGADEEISILDLARRVVSLAGSSSPVRLVPYAEAFPEGGFEDMPRRLPDTGRLRALTGWSARRSLDDTIRGCLETVQPG
ncbi:MAG: NAD-dependent epimerase/dehydratase family protein [Planctomycetes bacterium]|nr:NAD-dependent epimerase/dehydratase family protein [Planctomycetota bacterium]